MNDEAAYAYVGAIVLLSVAATVGISAFLGVRFARMRSICPRCQAKALRVEGGTKGIAHATYFYCEGCGANLKNLRGEWLDVENDEWGESA